VLIFGLAVARTRRNVLRLIRSSELSRLLRLAPDEDLEIEDDDDADFNPRWRRRRRPRPDPNRFPKVPSDLGTELMSSGSFGSNPAQDTTSGDRNDLGRKKQLAMRILDRELASGSYANQRLNNRLMAQVILEVPVLEFLN